MVQVKTWASIIKWTNIITGIYVLCCGVYAIITFQYFRNFHFLQLWSIFTPIFIIIFGIMLIGLEFKQEVIYEYFQFLGGFVGRGVFYIFLGSIASYQVSSIGGSSNLLDWLWGFVLFLIGTIFICFHFAAPGGTMDEIKKQVLIKSPAA